MVIFGSAAVGICLLLGDVIGDAIGALLGVDTNVGGVGFAMLLLIVVTNYIVPEQKMSAKTSEGIQYWQLMYIPVVIAMSSIQNVAQAISGGAVAIIGGVLAVVLSFAVLMLLSGKKNGKEVE